MEILVSFLISIAASVIANYICKWLDIVIAFIRGLSRVFQKKSPCKALAFTWREVFDIYYIALSEPMGWKSCSLRFLQI